MYSRNALMHGDVRLKSNFEKREVTAGHNKVFNLVNDQNIKNFTCVEICHFNQNQRSTLV